MFQLFHYFVAAMYLFKGYSTNCTRQSVFTALGEHCCCVEKSSRMILSEHAMWLQRPYVMIRSYRIMHSSWPLSDITGGNVYHVIYVITII